MFEIIQKGGLVMWPIIACSVLAMGIICERFWALRTSRVLPPGLLAQIWHLYREKQLDAARIRMLGRNSPLGAVLASGLNNHHHGRSVMKDSIEEAGRQVVHELGRFLDTLGTIASISPLLGLLGTVTGMITVFSAINIGGVGDPVVMSRGISEALITTAAGLFVAIPSLMFHRYFQGRVIDLVLKMEEEALKLVEILHGDREVDPG
ncbi:MAG: MotA/TolQ/ExbB proton channel family protein [Methylococcaceae bacterium]|nr:MotA/TolQ/ExbB proton channel family protein [Methylococcaceae bacterium]MCI0732599.1 MotA/TolQ/ExbB proton channel family protein [Methylococcaceae bacterium]